MGHKAFRVREDLLVDGVSTATNAALTVSKGSTLLTDGEFQVTNGPKMGFFTHTNNGNTVAFARLYTYESNKDIRIQPHGTGKIHLETSDIRLGIAEGNAQTSEGTTEAVKIDFMDNNAAALDIGSYAANDGTSTLVSYLKFDTTNSSERVVVGKDTHWATTSGGTATLKVENVAHNLHGGSLVLRAGSSTVDGNDTPNKNAGGMTLETGQSKGTGTTGNMVFKTGQAGSSGYSYNALVERLKIYSDKSRLEIPTTTDFHLGSSTKSAISHEASDLSANTAFNESNSDRSNKIIGTSDHLGWNEDSLVITNSTSGGDIFFAVNVGGHSKGLLKLSGTGKNVAIAGEGKLTLHGNGTIGGQLEIKDRADGGTYTFTGASNIHNRGTGVTANVYTLPDRIGTGTSFSTADAHGHVLAIASSTTATASAATLEWKPISVAADDISIGDAAVNFDTSSGDMNIGTGSYNKTITYGIDNDDNTVHHTMQGTLQSKRTEHHVSTGIQVNGNHTHGDFTVTVKTVDATTLSVGDRLYSSGGDFYGTLGHIESATIIWIVGGLKMNASGDSYLFLGPPTVSIYADYTDDDSDNWLPADNIGSRLNLITNHTFSSLTDAESLSMQAGVLDFYASGGKVTNANSSKQHVHHIGSIETRYDNISASQSMLKKNGTMDFKVSTQSTTGDPVRGLRIIGSNEVTLTGVLVNNGSGYAVGGNAITVDGPAATSHFSVGDIVYLASGKAVGVVSAVATTQLTFDAGIYEALADDVALFKGAGRVDVTIGATESSVTTITGDLVINGDTTTLNTTELLVEDKLITIGNGLNSANMDGGGITFGSSVAAITYQHTGTRFLFDKSVNLSSGLSYQINGTTVLDASGVTVPAINNEVTIDTYTSIGGSQVASGTLTGTSGTAGTIVVGSYDYSAHRSTKFIVQIYNDSDDETELYEVLVTYKGDSAPADDAAIYWTTYGVINTGTALGDFSVGKYTTGGATDIQLKYTSTTSADKTVIVRTTEIKTKI